MHEDLGSYSTITMLYYIISHDIMVIQIPHCSYDEHDYFRAQHLCGFGIMFSAVFHRHKIAICGWSD